VSPGEYDRSIDLSGGSDATCRYNYYSNLLAGTQVSYIDNQSSEAHFILRRLGFKPETIK